MLNAWYPQGAAELNEVLDEFIKQEFKAKAGKINGLIVPHAGYAFSGEIAGNAFSLIRDKKITKAIILSPSHYIPLSGTASHNQTDWKTALGKIKVTGSKFKKADISQEHAIDNQIPFLQKLGFKEILPILVGKISEIEAKQIAEKLLKIKGAVFIISTDLSHFLPYSKAVKKDRKTINAVISLNSGEIQAIENSACGIFPLLILIELCKLRNWKPKLVEYKNSGDITGEKSSVVGYASFVF